jgi:hypothetical protein
MTDHILPMPHGGGSWIRHPDGSLTLDEAPTMDAAVAREAEVATAVSEAVKAPVKRAATNPVKEA